MLKSMTGFGRAKYEVNSREYIIDNWQKYI